MAGAASAGILLYRVVAGRLEVLIGHPGGPFWANKQTGAWSIPKGLPEPGESLEHAAVREFHEETGHPVPDRALVELGSVVLRSGKTVFAWAVEGDLDASTAHSNPVEMEWPRGSGRVITFPEIDEFRWCPLSEAEELLNQAQRMFLARLSKTLDHRK